LYAQEFFMPTLARLSAQCPLERLLAGGAVSLSDAELLAMILRTRKPTAAAIARAGALLASFGTLGGLFAAPRALLLRTPGIGKTGWCSLQAALETSRRSLAGELHHRDVLNSPEEVGRYLALSLQHSPSEIFAILFLDSRNRLIGAEELFRGTLTQTVVYPREVVRRALERNAASVILAHNHPSGIAEPSQADRQLTEALKRALQYLDIAVLDHLIIAGGHHYSFAAHGLL